MLRTLCKTYQVLYLCPEVCPEPPVVGPGEGGHGPRVVGLPAGAGYAGQGEHNQSNFVQLHGATELPKECPLSCHRNRGHQNRTLLKYSDGATLVRPSMADLSFVHLDQILRNLEIYNVWNRIYFCACSLYNMIHISTKFYFWTRIYFYPTPSYHATHLSYIMLVCSPFPVTCLNASFELGGARSLAFLWEIKINTGKVSSTILAA